MKSLYLTEKSYTKSLYLIEKSISNLKSIPKSLYLKVYTKSLYLTDKVYTKSLYLTDLTEKYIRKVYI